MYECKDGRWLQLTAADRYAKAHDPVGAKFWQSFCRVLDRPDLADDPRFATTDMRQQHRDVLTPMINEAFLPRTYAEWEERLRAENLMYGPILSPEQVIEDPQALANDFFDGGRPARRRHVPHHQLAQQVRAEPGLDQVDHAGARRADGRDPRRARLQHQRHQ